jgi:hypothetical protein
MAKICYKKRFVAANGPACAAPPVAPATARRRATGTFSSLMVPLPTGMGIASAHR